MLRIEDVEAFARESLVLLLRHDPTGVALDVSMAWTAFEHDAIEACTDAKFGAVTAPMARAEDLVVFKAMAARPKDIEDASALLLMHKDINLDRVRRRLGELAAMADEPALVAGLEQVIRRSTTTATSTTAQVAPPHKAKPRSPRAPAKPRNKARRHKRTGA